MFINVFQTQSYNGTLTIIIWTSFPCNSVVAILDYNKLAASTQYTVHSTHTA